MRFLSGSRKDDAQTLNSSFHIKAAQKSDRELLTTCHGQTFIRDYSDEGRLPEIKQKIVDMALNGSGIRDTARVLGISTATVINELKKKSLSYTRLTRLF